MVYRNKPYNKLHEDFLPHGCSEKNPDEAGDTTESTESSTLSSRDDGLLHCKLFYFCFNSAMGSLWPYFPLYFRQQFLTPRQVGAIVASRTLVQFLFVPLWCTIAEKFRKHKQLLLLGLIAWLVSTLGILVIPREEPKACLEMNKDVETIHSNSHSKVWFDFSPLIEPKASTVVKESIGKDSNTLYQELKTVKILPNHRRINLLASKPSIFHKPKYLLRDRIKKKVSDLNRQKREHDGIYDDYYSPATMYNISTDLATIYAEYDPEKHITDSSRSFILLLVITIVGVSLASPAQTLVDICTMKLLKSESEQTFGRQVVWAAIGSASFAFIVGSFVSFFKIENPCTHAADINYSPCFYAFAFFMVLTLCISTRFDFETNSVNNNSNCSDNDGNVHKDGRTSCSNPNSNHKRVNLDESIANLWECVKTINDIHLASLLVVTFYCGFGNGFISTFLFWHLREMGGLQILLALVSLINSTAEVLFYILSDQLMGLVGHFRLIYIGLFCFSARFFYYSFLRQPWLVLPIEITHGMTSAAIRSSMISYIRQEGAAGHILHGLFNGIHGGLGFSIGGLVGGFMVHNYGHTITFLIFGELSLLTLFCFILVNNVWPQTKHDLKDSVSYYEILKTKKTEADFRIFGNESVDHTFHNLSTILSNSRTNDKNGDIG